MNILIVRSASRIFYKTLRQLKTEFPESVVTVIATEDAAFDLARDKDIDELVIVPSKSRMKLRHLGLKRIFQLRRKRFDLAVSLYNYDSGVGYSNIDFMIWAFSPKKHRGYNVYGQYMECTKGRLLARLIREKASFVFISLNVVFTVLLFFAVTLGILLEGITRKFYSAFAKRELHG